MMPPRGRRRPGAVAGGDLDTALLRSAEEAFDDLMNEVDPGQCISNREKLKSPRSRASVRRLVAARLPA